MGFEERVTTNVKGSPEDVADPRSGTTQDKQDMWRVGRNQELNVCVFQQRKSKN
jgi:hypothetical protein